MRPILILTKNLLTEQKLQEELQHLNYEVFCSASMLKQLRNNPNHLQITQSYQAIIFSETLTNQEVEKLRILARSEDSLFIRKFIQEPSDMEKQELTELGIDTWIHQGQTLDVLREHLAANLSSSHDSEDSKGIFLYNTERSPNTLAEFKKGLTKRELGTFECLLNSEGGLLSREALCSYLWKDEPNNSRLTQISVLIKRLKEKLKVAGFQEDLIETVWGYGYRLSPKLLQFYNHELVE